MLEQAALLFIVFFCRNFVLVANHSWLLKWTGDMFTEEQNEMIESAAEMLYGLIHVRYILTGRGMAAMVCSRICIIFHFPSLAVLFSGPSKLEFMVNLQLEKFKNYDFGRCPRVHCSSQPCLPVGQSDIPRSSTVKIYCPKCEDIHYPRSKYQGSILLFSNLLNLLFY